MKQIDHQAFIHTALELALKAGERIMKIYQTDFEIETKGDQSPVTKADIEAEAIILKGLRAAFPKLPIVAEEEAAAGNIPDIGDHFVLVDPLDGTREFTSRNGAFTVNIALISAGIPVIGVVHAPALKRTFGGVVADKAFELIEGTSTPIGVRKADPDNIVAVASRSHRNEKTDTFLTNSNVKDTVSIGSSLKFCLLAAGEADIYPRFGRTMEWDTAAGHAILSAAGGSVINEDGTPFVYGKRNQSHDADFANPSFIARGNFIEREI
ncbi:MAG: 3'(2'),5'-bisphosphate nucleotidase CysQ [Hyphomicrobiales bacterium]